MTTHPTPSYRPIAEQVAAARAGEYAGETEDQRLQRYAGVAAVGRDVLEEFAVRLGGAQEKEALKELLCCLMARCWEIDEKEYTARTAGGVYQQPAFQRAVQDAAFRLELAGRTDEIQPDDDNVSVPGIAG